MQTRGNYRVSNGNPIPSNMQLYITKRIADTTVRITRSAYVTGFAPQFRCRWPGRKLTMVCWRPTRPSRGRTDAWSCAASRS
ncbi:protein of unknown function [Streptomyces murinus]